MTETNKDLEQILFFSAKGDVQPVSRDLWCAKNDILQIFKGIANTECFVDIGASVGQTMVAAFAFNRQIKYFGFEPNIEAYIRLKHISKVNNFDTWLFPWGCSNKPMPFKLHSLNLLDTAATIRPDLRRDTYNRVDGSWIATYPLDTISSELNLDNHFIMKIDVEGAEYEVLQGAKNTIEKYRPVVMCEILNAHSNEELGVVDINKINIQRFFSAMNYKAYLNIFDSNDNYGDGRLIGLKRCEELPRGLLYKNAPNSNDYLFVPKEFPDVEF